jgi:hypothetical protein
MRAIRSRLSHERVIAIDFDAWRYEREPELLIPLLDVVRRDILAWTRQGSPPDARDLERVRDAARRIGRVVRALVSGVSMEVGLPGAAKVSYDAGAALKALDPDQADGEGPQSLFVAGLEELAVACRDVVEGGASRIVVFIDDLDRCLPTSALQVLEAVKLFFDLPGFVFVVGFDSEIMENAVRPRLWPVFLAQAMNARTSAEPERFDLGPGLALARAHFDKLFQIQYEIPSIPVDQLDDLLSAMADDAGLGPSQRAELAERVQPYLLHLGHDGRLNPRQIKRFINSYTLEMMLRPKLDPDVVLALRTIECRPDWAPAALLLRAQPAAFVEALTRLRDGDAASLHDMSPLHERLPRNFADFAMSEQASALAAASRLEEYLPSPSPSSARASWDDAADELDDIRTSAPLPQRVAVALPTLFLHYAIKEPLWRGDSVYALSEPALIRVSPVDLDGLPHVAEIHLGGDKDGREALRSCLRATKVARQGYLLEHVARRPIDLKPGFYHGIVYVSEPVRPLASLRIIVEEQ